MLKTFNDGEFVSAWYKERVDQYGLDIRSLGYNQRSSQQKRFETLCELGDFTGKTILDVGCGLGHFFDFLNENRIPVHYTGIDLVPEMIAKCKTRFKEQLGTQCEFVATDTMEYAPSQKFDYVVASGIFGLLSENARERIVPTLQRFLSWSKVGAAANFLSARSTRPAEGRLYLDPAVMLSEALSITPAVRLSHSYLPNDFTLFLYRTPSWAIDPDHSVNGNAARSGVLSEAGR